MAVFSWEQKFFEALAASERSGVDAKAKECHPVSMNHDNRIPIRRALLSVSDKSGLVDLAHSLWKQGVEILSTGGTARLLREHDVPVVDVADFTGFPEMLDGRVKTLHPAIHGALLARRDLPEHMGALQAHGLATIDLVVVNLYPFENVLERGDASFAELVENIDIGGPSMLRSAAKNHDSVAVVCDPVDYSLVQEALGEGGTTHAQRLQLALKVFARTASYDEAIARGLTAHAPTEAPTAPHLKSSTPAGAWERLDDTFRVDGVRHELLRYGENPHQQAAVYTTSQDEIQLAGAPLLQGKALSYNNLLDAEAAFFSLRCLTEAAHSEDASVVVIKHGTPCGAAKAGALAEAWQLALSGDPVSAFGGIVACSQVIDGPTAEAMSQIFLEVIVAPGLNEEAREVLARKTNLRLLVVPNLVAGELPRWAIRTLPGGFLVQEHDRPFTQMRNAQVVTQRTPSEEEWRALDIAFRMCAAVRSNAITLVQGQKLIGAGGGQTSRVDSVRLAIEKATTHGHRLAGAALGSDAFFPFADGLEAAAQAGVSAIAQPGGSKRDAEVIEAANAHGMTMVFTGERHFRH